MSRIFGENARRPYFRASTIPQAKPHILTICLVMIILLPGLCILTLGTHSVHAQVINLGNDVAHPILGAGHDYIHMLSETVNPANGSLNIRIDVPMPKGRGRCT